MAAGSVVLRGGFSYAVFRETRPSSSGGSSRWRLSIDPKTNKKGFFGMILTHWLIILCGLIALAYGVFTGRQVMAADAGTARMQQIAAAVQEGARAYLNRQYRTIGIVGVVIALILLFTLGAKVAIGFIMG